MRYKANNLGREPWKYLGLKPICDAREAWVVSPLPDVDKMWVVRLSRGSGEVIGQ